MDSSPTKSQLSDKAVQYCFGKTVSLNHLFYAFRSRYLLQEFLLEIGLVFVFIVLLLLIFIFSALVGSLHYDIPWAESWNLLFLPSYFLSPLARDCPIIDVTTKGRGYFTADTLCGQLWLVWGVSCWLVCWRKLTAWQISCAACFLVYLRAFFCMHVWLFAMPYLFLLRRTLKHCLWGLRHFVCFLCEMGLTVCGNVNMGVSWRQVY